MAAASTLKILAQELALAFAPLKRAVGGVDAFRSFIARLGWVVDSLPLSYQALSPRVDQALASVHSLADDPDPTDVLDALEELRQLVAAIRSLSEAPAGVDAVAFLDDVRGALVELLLVDYLATRVPLLHRLLSVTGVIQEEVHEAEGDRPTFVKSRFRFEEIPRLLGDPSLVPERVYGWGTPNLDMRRITSDLLELFSALGLAPQIAEIDRARQDGYQPNPADVEHSMSLMLVVPLFEKVVAANSVQAGFAILELPTEVGKLPGIVVEPFVPSEVGSSFSISDDLTFAIRAGSDIAATFGLLIRPGELGVRYPFEPGHSLPSAGFGMTLRYAPTTTTVLVGRPSGTRLQIAGAETGLAVDVIDEQLQFIASLETNGLSLVIAASDPDSFLGDVLGGKETEIPFPLGVRWSSKTGFGFQGGALAATVSPNRSIGSIRVDTLSIALHGEQPQGKASQAVLEVGAGLAGAFGPVAFTIDGVGFRMIVAFEDGNLGPIDFSVGFKPPTGVGLVIDTSVVVGGGFLRFDETQEEYSGMLELQIAETIAVKAIGLLTTRMPDGGEGYPLVVIIFAEGFTPIQLGFGFALTGIGGLLGINRTFNEDALRAGLKNHTLDSVMFPIDPIRNASQIISNLNSVFPPAAGHYLFGPMVQIAWGTPPLITAEVGVVLEFGARLRLLILAQVAAILPKRENDLVRLQMDAIGVIDFDEGTAALDATLYDSRLLKKFVLTGDMAMRLQWEASPNFALAVGGLHPAFNPPPNFPKLERIALNLCAGDNPRLRCEAYFALTSNTVQFGAHAELYAAAIGFSIQGEIGFDVLIQRAPFYFLADFYAQLQLKRNLTSLFKVRVEGALEGPRPLHIKAKATFEILWWDVSIRIDKTLVEGELPPLPEPIDVLPLLREALSHPGNWRSQLPTGQRPMVTLRAKLEEATDVLLHPLGTLTVTQSVVPLNMDISRFGPAAPAGARRFTVSNVSPGDQNQTTGLVVDFFAPAQFFEMSDDEKLSTPSFQSLTAGLRIGSNKFAFTDNPDDRLEVNAITFDTKIVDKQTNTFQPSGSEDLYQLRLERLDQQARFGAAGASELRRTGKAKYRTTRVGHKLVKEGWSIIATADLLGQAAPGLVAGASTSYSEAAQALRKLQQENPAKARGLKILRLSELPEVDNPTQ